MDLLTLIRLENKNRKLSVLMVLGPQYLEMNPLIYWAGLATTPGHVGHAKQNTVYDSLQIKL